MICRSGQGRRILVNEAEKRGLWTKINSLLRLWADHQICSYKFSCNTHLRATYLGTIHLRHRHALGGEGSKICQICRRIVLKKCRRQGGRGQKSVKIYRRLKWMVPQWTVPYTIYIKKGIKYKSYFQSGAQKGQPENVFKQTNCVVC